MITLLALSVPLLFQAAPPQSPAQLRHAKIAVRAVAPGGLSAEVTRIAGGAGPVWIGWSQPIVAGNHHMCCFDRIHKGMTEADFCCGGCALERGSSFTYNVEDGRPVQLESPDGLVVLLRVERGRIGRVRALDDHCGIDAGGLSFVWLTTVRPEESVTLLASLARKLDDREGEDAAGSALAAIAYTSHPSVDELLTRLMSRGEPIELRKQAAFWMGTARGRNGYDALRAALADPDPDFREHLMFALSQNSVPEAQATLIDVAKHDRDGAVRGQALFWLAQKAADRAAETIQNAIQDDPDEDVKVKAVFALSQLPSEQGVTELIRVARRNRNPEVRKQAIFWLGQSRDPRALAFIEEILDR